MLSYSLQNYIILIIGFFGAVIAGLIVRYVLVVILRSTGKRSRGKLFQSLSGHIGGPLYILLPLIVLSVVFEIIDIPQEILDAFKRVMSVLFVITASWLFAKLTFVLEDIIMNRFRIDVKDNLKARKIYTQLQFFKRGVIIAISIIALAIILMSFDKVRQLGTAILASAGVLGIVIGFAAQRTLANLIAGLQIAIAQPFRIDDVVVIEGEWGRIEEITLTYVVVRIWDLRRLVLPITYFLEKPFQNWTRETARLLCTVFIYTDYTVAVEEIRSELHRILGASEYWDGEVWNLQVTNSSERCVELRALMSVQDASTGWNLRCEVREKLLGYLQSNHPGSLPKLRADINMEQKNTMV
jgi:small-conductance mechanosensitive channel